MRYELEHSGKYCRFCGKELKGVHYSDQRDSWTDYSCDCPPYLLIVELKELETKYLEDKQELENRIEAERRLLLPEVFRRCQELTAQSKLEKSSGREKAKDAIDVIHDLISSKFA